MTVVTSKSPKSVIRSSRSVDVAKGNIYTIQHDRTWEQFVYLQKGYENSNVRLSFYEGTVGILMPGRAHEVFKKLIGFFIEFFLHHKRIEFVAIGSTTQEQEGTAASEPDKSYEIEGMKLAVEVNFTSGDTSKIKRYQTLGFDEVWIWEDGVLDVYCINADDYKKVPRSSIPALSSLDLQILSDCILMGETSRIAAGDKLIAAHS